MLTDTQKQLGTERQTDTQDNNYYRRACTPRVKENSSEFSFLTNACAVSVTLVVLWVCLCVSACPGCSSVTKPN